MSILTPEEQAAFVGAASAVLSSKDRMEMYKEEIAEKLVASQATSPPRLICDFPSQALKHGANFLSFLAVLAAVTNRPTLPTVART